MKGTYRLATVSSLLLAIFLFSVEIHAQPAFRRGDVDDSGGINLADPLLISQLDLLAATPVPTLGEWGMLFATLSLLAAGTSVIIRRRRR